MENFYTTRFNPFDWPPASGAFPPGVESNVRDLVERGYACCELIEILGVVIRPLETPWIYHATHRIGCPYHGEATVIAESRLDWISPNEYLLVRKTKED